MKFYDKAGNRMKRVAGEDTDIYRYDSHWERSDVPVLQAGHPVRFCEDR